MLCLRLSTTCHFDPAFAQDQVILGCAHCALASDMTASKGGDPMAGLLSGMAGLETGIWKKHNQSLQDMKSTTPDRSRDSSFTSGNSRISVPQPSTQGSSAAPVYTASRAPQQQQAQQQGAYPPIRAPAQAKPSQRPSSFQDVQFDGLLSNAGFPKANKCVEAGCQLPAWKLSTAAHHSPLRRPMRSAGRPAQAAPAPSAPGAGP